MNEALAIDTFCAEELVEGFIGRMTAPEPEELEIEQPGWWHRGALAGLAGGLVLGALAYALGPAAEPRPAAPATSAGASGQPAVAAAPAIEPPQIGRAHV